MKTLLKSETPAGWTWVARPRKCGTCAKGIDAGELAYLTRVGSARCRDCWEDVLGVCQLSYDTAPLEPLVVTVSPQKALDPDLERIRQTATAQPTMTETELRMRQAKHARRLERWRERNPRR